MRNIGLLAAMLMSSGLTAGAHPISDVEAERDLVPTPRVHRTWMTGRRRWRFRGSKYMPHSGAKEQAKHLARRAAGIIECPHNEEAPLAMAA
jgi:hypothetical protein